MATARFCPQTGRPHTSIKLVNPTWRYCPDCNIPLPNLPTILPECIDLTASPPRSVFLQSGTVPQSPNSTHMQPTTGLTAPGTSLHQPTLSNFALSSKLAKSYRDQSITETKEKKPQITCSIGIKLYFAEYYEEVICGEPSPIYTILHQHRISGPKRLVINEKWEDHSALIQFLFDTHKISEGLRQKQWKFIAPLPASNCLKVVHLGLDETASISIAQIRDYSGSDRKGDDIFYLNLLYLTIIPSPQNQKPGVKKQRGTKKAKLNTIPVQPAPSLSPDLPALSDYDILKLDEVP
ncbi:uncharacterized protein B0I36DRAFT_9950 [Microdochium trichocladiopsis]|uniref:Uncharacterized protein n=1 Tax=Microdochium trichocladiopsis TaxID=1682393 RepID=A0A9P9BZS1_9PEZI|nr:uncharacterized protein B0I36DRAFT_9950 [Microdochium trichocladiopsis]KAH7040409.1 hypothetical protein B0I36DRAFT_9950 [Microdochium trichocladiopsis]